jgi:hypothetical protein
LVPSQYVVADDAASPAMNGPIIDVAAVVAEVEAEVERRRAAGEYPEDLIERLRAEFHIVSDDDAPEELAVIDAVRPIRSDRSLIGPTIVFAKRVVRRLLAWYVQPIAADQTSFNLSLLRDLRNIERRLARVETPWVSSSRIEADTLSTARMATYGGDLQLMRGGRVVVLGGGPTLEAAVASVGCDVLRTGDTDPLTALEGVVASSASAVVLAGLIPRLSARETLRVFSAAETALKPQGVLVVDNPLPTAEGALMHAAAVDPTMMRWIPAETVTLLCAAVGFDVVRVDTVGDVQGVVWYAVVARRPTQ